MNKDYDMQVIKAKMSEGKSDRDIFNFMEDMQEQGKVSLAEFFIGQITNAVRNDHPDYLVDEVFFDNGEIHCRAKDNENRITLHVTDYIYKIMVKHEEIV